MNKPNLPSGVEPAYSTYLHAKGARLGLPISGNFELTARCNFRCKMCYVHHEQDPAGELTAAQWIALGKQAADKGMIFLLLTGGEPLLRSDFREIYTGLKKLGLLISLNTNGFLLDEEMVEFLKKDPPLRINISLYGGNNGDYQSLCGVPAFERVTENIKRAKRAGLQLRLNCSVTPENAAAIPAIHAFARENDLRIKGTTYMFPPVRVNGCQYGDSPCRFTPEAAAEHMLRWREELLTPEQLAASCVKGGWDEDDCSDGQGDPMRCRAGRTAFWVTWDGRMLPCGMVPGEGYALADHGFDRAWELVRQDCAAIRMPAKCTTCTYRPVCALCAASCLTETGGFDRAPEYVCRMTEHLNTITRAKYG